MPPERSGLLHRDEREADVQPSAHSDASPGIDAPLTVGAASAVDPVEHRDVDAADPTAGLSQSTLGFYRRTARQLAQRIERRTGLSWESDPLRFVEEVIQERDRVRPASWRILRASTLLFLREQRAPIEAINRMESTRGVPGAPSLRLRPRKKKALPVAVMQTIEDVLRSPARHGLRKTTIDGLLVLWLDANIEIGLRPNEWGGLRATRQPNGTVLVSLPNAKNSHGRATGAYRSILVSGAAGEKILRVCAERDSMLEFGLTWGDLVRRMRRRLYAVRLAEGGLQNVGLYSTRHQSVANLKSSRRTPEEIAQTFGHASTETAQQHYGKARVGSGQSSVIAAAAGPNRDAAEAMCLALAAHLGNQPASDDRIEGLQTQEFTHVDRRPS